MNAHDAERIKGMLESLGLGEAVGEEEADVLVFNTCTVREKPDSRLAAYLGNAAAPEGFPRAGDRGDGGVAERLRARAPAAPVRLLERPQAHAPHVRPRTL